MQFGPPYNVPYGLPKSTGLAAQIIMGTKNFTDPAGSFVTDNVQVGEEVFILSSDPFAQFSFIIDQVVNNQIVRPADNFLVSRNNVVYKVGLETELQMPELASRVEVQAFFPYSVHHAQLWIDGAFQAFRGDEFGTLEYIGGSPI